MMITWQGSVQTPENTQNFAVIRDWWNALDHKTVAWKQRVIPEEGEIDWNSQRFDETFEMADADVRGISFYWKKEGRHDTGNTTPAKIEFDSVRQRVFFYPENQAALVLRVDVQGVTREVVTLNNPVLKMTALRDADGLLSGARIVLVDDAAQKEILVNLNESGVASFKDALQEL